MQENEIFPLLGLSGAMNNDLDIAGLSDDTTVQILGAMASMPPQQRAKAFKAVAKHLQGKKGGRQDLPVLKGSRAEFLRALPLLPKEIREGLENNRLQLNDMTFYAVKYVEGLSLIDQFATDDDIAIGICNIAKSQLKLGEWFILHAIRLESADTTATAVTAAGVAAASFGVPIAGILNGEFKIECGGKVIIPPTSPLSRFNTVNKSNVDTGLVVLDNPKLIQPQVDIKAELRFPAAINGTNNTYLRMQLIGTVVKTF